jgi:predicted peptidase
MLNIKLFMNVKINYWVYCLLLLTMLAFQGIAQKVESYKSLLTGDVIKYAVYLPQHYDGHKKYALLLFLHGMNEKTWPVGSFNPGVKLSALPKLLESGLKLPFIVVVPNCAYSDWDNIGYTSDNKVKLKSPGAWAVEIARMASEKYTVDTNRRYITGISMGGGGAFSALQYFPEVFAAGIPIAGWGSSDKGCNTKTNVWAFQGSKDGGEAIKKITETASACNPQYDIKATILDGYGHNVWDLVYANKASGGTNIYDWLLKYSLKFPETR